MLRFEVATEPIPLARARFGHGRAYLPKRSREYRCRVAEAAREALNGRAPITGELTCKLEFYRKYKRSARIAGDIDNHVKAVLDALNGICYDDDAQVVSLTATKFTDKQKPRLVVELNQLP